MPFQADRNLAGEKGDPTRKPVPPRKHRLAGMHRWTHFHSSRIGPTEKWARVEKWSIYLPFFFKRIMPGRSANATPHDEAARQAKARFVDDATTKRALNAEAAAQGEEQVEAALKRSAWTPPSPWSPLEYFVR